MTLDKIITLIKDIALAQPNVNSTTEGSIYEAMNTTGEVEYANVHLTQSKHVESSNKQEITYNFILFYTDRLLEDKSNKVTVHSIGINVLTNILKTIELYSDNVEVSSTDYQTFTEQFADICAGVYSNISITVPLEYTCAETFGNEVEIANTKVKNETVEVDITRNGTRIVTYDPEYYTGLEKVTINTNIPTHEAQLQEKTITIDKNGNSTIIPDKEFDGISKVNITTNIEYETEELNVTENGAYFPSRDGYSKVTVDVDTVNNQNKEVSYSQNGEYRVVNDKAYTGLGEVKIKVNVPEKEFVTEELYVTTNGEYLPLNFDGYSMVNVNVTTPKTQEEKSIIFREEGNYTINPDLGYEAVKKINVTVDIDSITDKNNIFIKNGNNCFYGNNSIVSFGDIYVTEGSNMNSMFEDCTNLIGVTDIIPNENIVSIHRMFDECEKLGEFTFGAFWKGLKIQDAAELFYGCTNLREVDLTNLDLSEATRVYGMFDNCPNLTSIKISTLPDIELSFLNGTENLTMESIVNIFNALPETNSRVIWIPKKYIYEMNNREVFIAADKGWTIKY